MKLTIIRPSGSWPGRGVAIQVATCYALRHRHTATGYREDGCRCPSTLEALEEARELSRVASRRYRAGIPTPPERTLRGPVPRREIDDCPAERHRHSYLGYTKDGCRCPSTVKAYDRRQETQRAALAAFAERQRQDPSIAVVDLRRADRIDAEAIALGYRIGRTSVHTRGLAVRMIRDAEPGLTDRQVAWKLTAAGQGRMVHKRSGEVVFEPVSVRQVQRIQAALARKVRNDPKLERARLDRTARKR